MNGCPGCDGMRVEVATLTRERDEARASLVTVREQALREAAAVAEGSRMHGEHGDHFCGTCRATTLARVAIEALVGPPAAPAVEGSCRCGHARAEHHSEYTTPYNCVAGQKCLCGHFRLAAPSPGGGAT